MRSQEFITESRQPGEYVYHASFVGNNKAQWLRSLIQKGLQPSKEGYSGPGTYFAYEPDEGYYHVTPEDSMILRVRWADLVKLYGVYPDNPNGIERDDDEIIVPGPVPGNILEVEYFEDEWWDLKSALGAETYHYENVEEAETGTKFARSVSATMRKAGYKKLGSGADATVWARDAGSVVKIIMPEDGGTGAAKTFKRFVDFCNEHKDVPNLPKFTPVDEEVSSKLNFNGEQYIYFAMERLQPIKSGSFEEAMVWILSDLAVKNTTWEQAFKVISKPDTWRLWDDGMPAEQIIQRLKTFGPREQAEYGLLFTIMVLLYKTGRINKLGWDLHTENVMQRSNGTLVIVDPWFVIEEQ